MSQADTTTPAYKPDPRDARLWSLLPPKTEPYDSHKLSKAETAALVEALGDGFEQLRFDGKGEALPLPSLIQTGLLKHSFYCGPDSKYDPEECDDEFFVSDDDDQPAPADVFPLNFDLRRLEIYFTNQLERFRVGLEKQELVVLESESLSPEDKYWKPILQSESLSPEDKWWKTILPAARRLYKKPWYEYHALQFIDWIRLSKRGKYPRYSQFDLDVAGQLGRLVEQYFWRFQFEAATAHMAARAGGKARAVQLEQERSIWQAEAAKAWAQHPRHSKITIADIVRKKTGSDRTAKHISRYILKP
jgi:hypothetical protein